MFQPSHTSVELTLCKERFIVSFLYLRSIFTAELSTLHILYRYLVASRFFLRPLHHRSQHVYPIGSDGRGKRGPQNTTS